ncbi:MFS transporter [Corynebacterium guangdongense]|uniref:GPH family glycoside/pentoside/hexuronide:cation symporter n=1 Tax=Corynebacterium guangdongense TaxID=1783348 RepID=A0ABU1ZTV4_9CORY|nr:glycoside-pentoside-hexuronide (GPH):cation symporter [Corynebacterium guangdongense]MDR7328366.1 GPH family glycoside/pentoside/hexuronide:cation symporter [Corynebacterium guangdongense]WJZ16943.1 putative symporter YjmB [Corynebacterium guangdongense]
MSIKSPESPTTSPRSVRPFGMRDRVGYMFGDFGNDFTFILQSSFFMIFYTNVVGIQPAHVGALLLGARVIDGFTDVGMGILVDRLPNNKVGQKFKRWVKWIAIPVAVASALMYMSFVSDFDSYGAKMAWMIATYFLWGSLCYTAINIPYGSMASVISNDPTERSQLSVWRSTGGTLANLAISTLLPLFVYVTNEAGVSILSGPRMTIAAVVCSVLAVICYAILYVSVEERIVEDPKVQKETVGLGKMLQSVFSNRALLGLIAAALLLLLSMMFLMGMLGYVFLTWFGEGRLQSPASLAGMLPALTLIVLAPWLAKRFGKAETAAVAMFIGGAVLLVAYFLKIENPWVWIGFYAVAMFAISVFNYLVWAFITDVIDYQEVRTGTRDDGTVYAVYSWARKLGQAAAGGLIGVALGWIGFDSAIAADGGAQPQEAIDGIYMLVNVLPGVGCILVALSLIFLYPLKKGLVEKNVALLAARRGEEVPESVR